MNDFIFDYGDLNNNEIDKKLAMDTSTKDYINSLLDAEERQTPEMLQKKVYCSRLMNDYLRRVGKSIDDDYSDVVPNEFEIFDSVDKKIQILEDAIANGLLIVESKYYIDIIEGIVDSSSNDSFFK